MITEAENDKIMAEEMAEVKRRKERNNEIRKEKVEHAAIQILVGIISNTNNHRRTHDYMISEAYEMAEEFVSHCEKQ